MIDALILMVIGCIVLGVTRFVLGPSNADRVIAIDILFSAGVSLSSFAAIVTGRVLFLDIAVGVALIGFVTTLAWSRLVELQDNTNREKDN